MNNSKLALDGMVLFEEPKVDLKVQLRQREETLVRIINALRGIAKTEEWSTLKTELFDSLVITLTNQINAEARKEDPDVKKQNRLAGQLKWAEKYSDLGKLENVFGVELQEIKKKLYGNEFNG